MKDEKDLIFATASPVILTEARRVAAFPVDEGDIAARLNVLEVRVTAISNPKLVPIGIAVWLQAGGRKLSIGNFAFYPATNPGTFRLEGRKAIAAAGQKPGAHVLLELRKLRDSAVWNPVQVTIEPPKWVAGKHD